MLQIIKNFLKDLTDFDLDESHKTTEEREKEIFVSQNINEPADEEQPAIVAEVEESTSAEVEPHLLTCGICEKTITWKEEVVAQKTEIEGIVAEMQLMGCECSVDLLCHQCAFMMAKDQSLSLQPYHFCFNWGNKDWNDELREIAKYYGEDFAQKSRNSQEDLRHRVIIDDLEEYKTMLQVLRRMNFRYPRKDISALLTEPEKRVYKKFTGKN